MMICIITFGGDVVIAVFVPVAGFAGGPFATGVAFASCYSKWVEIEKTVFRTDVDIFICLT